MKSEDFVRAREPRVKLRITEGRFSGGGTKRYDVMLGLTMIGCDTRQSSAWAQAMRWIKLRDGKRVRLVVEGE